MKNGIIFLFVLFLGHFVHAQNKVNISLVGSINNFTTAEKLFGSTLYMIQNGKTVAKAISDETGNYSITGLILIEDPIDLLVSKPGYASKRVLFDLKTLKVTKGRFTTLQLVEELIIELYENIPGSDLSFTKTSYAEKFTWDQAAFIARPDAKYKSEIDDRVKAEYAKVENKGYSKNFESRADLAIKSRDFEKAVAYYDSALTVFPKDSLIKIKKENVLATMQRIKEEEKSKLAYDAKKDLADKAFESSNFAEAEKLYNELLKAYPNDTYATAQLLKATASKAQEEQNKKNLAEATKLIDQATTLKSSKKFDESIAKLQQAIPLVPNQKQKLEADIASIKSVQSDIIVEDQVKKELKTADDLSTKKKFDESIKTYQTAGSTSQKFVDKNLLTQYSQQADKGVKKANASKISEDSLFQSQLKKAKENFDKGPASYSLAENILKADPMKGRVNDPEVVALINSIEKMKQFYTQKSTSYNLLKQNKPENALTQLKSTLDAANKNGKIVPTEQINQLKKSIDSLETILNPKSVVKQPTIDTTKLGVNLPIPGELVEGNASDVFKELAEEIEYQKSIPLENVENIKNEIDKEAYFNKKLIASRQEDDAKNIQERKNEMDVNALEKSKEAPIRQELLEEKKRELEANVYKKQQEVKVQDEKRAVAVQDWKNNTDSIAQSKSIESIERAEGEVERVQQIKNAMDVSSIDKKKENDLATENYQIKKIDQQYQQFKKDSSELVAQELRGIQLQTMKDSKVEIVNPANHLKDEKGIEFPWNKMTERIYKIKNKEGIVTTIITRRVVVDSNGYGVVYEQTTNDRGVNSYTKNQQPITEFIWANESSGLNVFKK